MLSASNPLQGRYGRQNRLDSTNSAALDAPGAWLLAGSMHYRQEAQQLTPLPSPPLLSLLRQAILRPAPPALSAEEATALAAIKEKEAKAKAGKA